MLKASKATENSGMFKFFLVLCGVILFEAFCWSQVKIRSALFENVHFEKKDFGNKV